MIDDNQSIVRAYLDAVAAWGLDDARVTPQAVIKWQDGQSLEESEEVLTRMLVVAHIKTALDVYRSAPAPLANKWMKFPNRVDPFKG